MTLKAISIKLNNVVATPLPDGKTAGQWSVSVASTTSQFTVTRQTPSFPIVIADLPPDTYNVSISRLDTDGNPLGQPSTTPWTIHDLVSPPAQNLYDAPGAILVETIDNPSVAPTPDTGTAPATPATNAAQPAPADSTTSPNAQAA